MHHIWEGEGGSNFSTYFGNEGLGHFEGDQCTKQNGGGNFGTEL